MPSPKPLAPPTSTAFRLEQNRQLNLGWQVLECHPERNSWSSLVTPMRLTDPNWNSKNCMPCKANPTCGSREVNQSYWRQYQRYRIKSWCSAGRNCHVIWNNSRRHMQKPGHVKEKQADTWDHKGSILVLLFVLNMLAIEAKRPAMVGCPDLKLLQCCSNSWIWLFISISSSSICVMCLPTCLLSVDLPSTGSSW